MLIRPNTIYNFPSPSPPTDLLFKGRIVKIPLFKRSGSFQSPAPLLMSAINVPERSRTFPITTSWERNLPSTEGAEDGPGTIGGTHIDPS